MIAASEPQEFVPFGRQHMRSHPGSVIVELNKSRVQTEPFLAQRFSQVRLNDSTEGEWWNLCATTSSKISFVDEETNSDEDGQPPMEKELYISGKTAVVSLGPVGCSIAQGAQDKTSSRIIKATYTMESPISQALFCTFLHSPTQPMPSLCIIEADKISVFVEEGQEYITPLQFKVANAWATKFGLLLERVAHSHMDQSSEPCNCDELTTVFSLLHPLDEISPLLSLKQGGVLSYMNDPAFKVVYTCQDPSLCLLYNTQTGLHSIWKLRWTSAEEKEGMCGQPSAALINTSIFSNSPLNPNLSSRPANHIRLSASSNKSGIQAETSLPTSSLIMPNNTSSPMSGSFMHYTLHSTVGTSSKSFSRIGSISSEARLGCSFNAQLAEPKPIVPEICLEYLWTESSSPGFRKAYDADGTQKAFLTKDVLGQEYLCYLVGGNFLTMVRLGRTNNTKTPELIVGTITYIAACDAVPIPAHNMLAVLESGGGVVIYTGTTCVGKLYIGGVSSEQASVSYLSAFSCVAKINSPFPKPQTPALRRTSLLSSTRFGDGVFDERMHLLSPVPQEGPPLLHYVQPSPLPPGGQQLMHGLHSSPFPVESSRNSASGGKENIIGLRDPIASRFTLEYANGSMFRFTMPEFSSSPLVTGCIKVLKRVLQKDVVLLTLSKWYSVRNAPGTQNISPKLEWQLFMSAIFDLLGYHLDSLPLLSHFLNADCDTPAKNNKKMKGPDSGTTEDWNYLIGTSYHNNNTILPRLRASLNFFEIPNSYICDSPGSPKNDQAFNSASALFPYVYMLLFPLHLLYEEMKLNPVFSECLPLLVKMLYQLARDLRLEEFAAYYYRDYPLDCLHLSKFESQVPTAALEKLEPPYHFKEPPPCLFRHLHVLVSGKKPKTPYPFINGVNKKSRNIIEVVGLLTGNEREQILRNVVPPGSRSFFPPSAQTTKEVYEAPSRDHEAALLLNSYGMTRNDMLNLPCGIGLVLATRIQNVTESPCQGWPLDACRLISRLDLVPNLEVENSEYYNQPKAPSNDGNISQISDDILKLRFNKDQRIEEVKKLLQSSEPVAINIVQRPEVSDHEFIEEQERYLYAISTRTMALPVGRGMMDLHTTVPVVVTEQLEIPKLCLSGRAPPRGTTIELSHIEVVPNMNLWPSFHNGVAAGLKISPRSKNVQSTWILYNKPKNGLESLPEHAGFLMALGLSGHLNNFMQLYLFNYLNKCHEMTSVGVLLGLAASKRGTMDVSATKIFSLHIESLLPPTSIELDLVQNIQVAALLGIGLVYQGTGHRHIAEALLSEIGRPPGPEMENSCDREGYSLAAGLGLGLVMLAKGSDPTGLADHDIADTLQYYMVGGHRRPLAGSQKEKYKSPSYQIREGDCVNNHVTGPGATLALGMMYFNTNNVAVANWLAAPESEYMLDFVCPDQLLLRTLAQGLVLWGMVVPTRDWVESHVPATIRAYCATRPRQNFENVDLETMNQAYCNIVAGACMVLGLRFAGSGNEQAFDILFYYCKMFTSMANRSIAELAGKSTIETCICVTLLSLATVMAGTGDLDVLRLCRHLGSRVGQATNSVVTYGSHLAIHMSLGLLFLGGGSLSFSNSPESVAALICAFFPRFPTHSNDNRYHLQAFRHLYVLAIEPRLFLPKDIDSGSLCYANLELIYLDTPYYSNQKATVFSPCILPHLNLLKEVRVKDDRYWPIIFTRGKNWDQLVETLNKGGSIGIKLRAGCLPYVDDPRGYKTLLAQTLSTDTAISWTISTDSILAFVSDKACRNFVENFLKLGPVNDFSSAKELKFIQWLSSISYECITKNMLPLLDYWIVILADLMSLSCSPSTTLMWQMKLILAIQESHIQPDHSLAIAQYITNYFDEWQSSHMDLLSNYILSRDCSASTEDLLILSSYLTFFDVPYSAKLQSVMSKDPKTFIEFVKACQPLSSSPATLSRLWSVYRRSVLSSASS
uniref:Anaphase-promoting complex subunit 1 n=2 Tax=Lygus hesperus TaxID=30085 RepID=A0A0A9VWC5_LYGHE